jgi:genome maintenance exonuclease 1
MSDTAIVEKDGSEFTAYTGFQIEYRDASHRYWIHEDGERLPVPSVTGANNVLDKAALIPWAERMGAEGALRLEREGKLSDTPIENAVYAMRSYGEGAGAKRDEGAERGTSIHEALRDFCEAGQVPSLSNWPLEHRGYVKALCRFLLKNDPEPVLVERVVGSVKHKYAGRLDLLARIKGKLKLIDLKSSTGKARVFREAHVQTAGYDLALPECGIELAETPIIVALGEDGSMEEVPSYGTPEMFLSVLECSRRMKELDALLRAREKAA